MSLESGYEKVSTVLDYYDGILTGVADYNGKPHFFECIFDKEEGRWIDTYLLSPIDSETLQLALEDWDIWLRWEAAFYAGQVKEDSEGALPEDRERHAQLKEILDQRLVINPENALKAKGDFRPVGERPKNYHGFGSLEVKWSLAE